MAGAFARKGTLLAVLAFALALGFGATIAEPTLITVAPEGANAAAGAIADTEGARVAYALYLRIAVALAVSVALIVGVFRILKGWPIHYLFVSGYAGTIVLIPAEA